MTKHLRFLFVMLLAMIWSAGWAQEVTMNFTDNTSWNFSTDIKNTKSGTYGKGNCAVSLTGGNYYFTTNKCLMLKENGTLTFTAFDFEVEKIVVKGNTGGSKNTKQNIYVNDKAVSSETTSSKVTNTYIINDKYQSVGTIYVLKVSNANAQINEILIYKKESSSSAKTDTKVSFDENSGKTFTFTEGKYSDGTFTTPTATETTGVAGTIAYSSSNATAISVDASTGALTFNGYGKATITAKFTPNNTEKYAESTDSYIVENKAESINAAFYESFNNCDGKAGWSGNVASNKWDAKVFDNSGWTKTGKAFLGAECIRIGKDASSVTTPVISLTGDAILTFMAGAWGTDNTTITVSVSDGTLTYGDNTPAKSVNIDLAQSTWVTYSMKISGTKSCKITFNNKTTSYRFFLDEVMVKNVAESGETTTITLDENSESNTIEAKAGVNVTLKRTMVKGEWNTICLPFEVSEKQAKDAFGEGVKIATLNKKSTGTTISFEDISILGIPASEPCLIKPSIDYPAEGYVFKDVTIEKGAIVPMEDSTDDSSFGFVGIYNKTDISTGIEKTIFMGEFYAAFLGAGNKIYKTDGSGNKTKGFRAYFAIPKSASASALRVVIDGTATSIKNIDSEVVESNAPVYNLQGQRVDGNNLIPGIYVKAGKKFVVK